MKIKIHPFFIAVAALCVWKCGLSAFFSALAAVLLHELSHAYAARGRGYVQGDILLLPYGAVLYNPDNLDKASNVIIALCGPLVNLVLALLTIAVWWLYPPSYALTKPFAEANLTIGLFNILPVYPLDGARVIFAVTGYKPRVQKALKITGLLLAAALMLGYVLLLSHAPNYSLLIMSVFLAGAALSGGDKEDFAYAVTSSPLVKDYTNGAYETVVYLSADATLKRALLLIKPNRVLTYKIVKNGLVTATFSETEMKEFFNTKPLKSKISEVIR